MKLEVMACDFGGHLPPGCGTCDIRGLQPVCFCRSDHPLCESGETRSMCCLQEMVSEYPRGEPLSQANVE